MKNGEELVPWGVVFIVLSAIVFCSSSLTTLLSSSKKTRNRAITLDDGLVVPQEEPARVDEPSVGRVLQLSRETMRPIQYVYSESRMTR